MIVYHGSNLKIETPDLNHSRQNVDGLISKAETLNCLKYEHPNMQICLRTNKAISQLHFKGFEII